MPKTFNFSFAINGVITPNFRKSMSAANAGLIKLKNDSKELKRELKQLGKDNNAGLIDKRFYNGRSEYLINEIQKNKEKQEKLSGLINRRDTAKSDAINSGKSLLRTGLIIRELAQPLMGMIHTAADFEAAMSKVGAITNATDSDMKQLTKTARELGEKTKFTATQSAEAMSYLGMAGWKAGEIIEGMPGLLNLAAAGGTDLARTADIVSDNLTAFGLSAKDAMHMADVYAVTITNTNTNIEMLGETMKYAAPVAHAFGSSMEETAALAGIMANAGIKASNAGTALRAGLIRLAGPPKMAAKALEELGLSMDDLTAEQKEASIAMKSLGIETGNTQGQQKMALILTQLREKMKDLGQEERLATAKAIFGQQAAAGWLAVLDSAPGTFEKLVDSLKNSDGAADKMAKRMQDNAQGAITRLQSAVESASISLAGVFLPAIAEAGDKLAGLAGDFSKFASEHPALIRGIGEVALSIVGLILAVKTLSTIYLGYKAVSDAFTAAQWAINASLAANPVGIIIVGIGALIAIGYQLYKNWDKISPMLTGLWNNFKSGVIAIKDAVKGKLQEAYQSVIGLLNAGRQKLLNGLTNVKTFFTNLPQNAAYAVGYIVGYIGTIPERIKKTLSNAIDSGAEFIAGCINWGAEAANGMLNWFSNLPDRIYNWLSTLPDKIMGIVTELESVGNSFITQASSWGSAAVDGIINWFTNLPGRLQGIVAQAWESAKGVLAGISSNYDKGKKEGSVTHNASGGIYGKGAFLTTFAEKSGESAIPHTPTQRNIGLLAETNRIMGNPLGGRDETVINASFSPNITINTGAGPTNEVVAALRSQMEEERRKFEEMLKRVEAYRRRTAYE